MRQGPTLATPRLNMGRQRDKGKRPDHRVKNLSSKAGFCYIYWPTETKNRVGKSQMNAHYEMDTNEVLRVKLEVLRQEHRDLDEAIHAMEAAGRADQLTLRRLKKQKLHLKDQIARLDDILIPDIIA